MNTAEPYVVFDLDDVLANLREHLMQMLKKRTGKDIHWHQWHEYKIEGLYGITGNKIMQWVHEDEIFEAATLEPGAIEAVSAAKAANYRVAVVTARAWHPNGESLTADWLTRHKLAIDELYIVPVFGDKAAILRKLGTVKHFVDDYLGHLYPAMQLPEVHQVYILDRPWNREDDKLQRLHSLDEFIPLL